MCNFRIDGKSIFILKWLSRRRAAIKENALEWIN